MNTLTFLCLIFLVIIVTGSAMLELKDYTHIECYQEQYASLEDCIRSYEN